jgi:hypothetical protein
VEIKETYTLPQRIERKGNSQNQQQRRQHQHEHDHNTASEDTASLSKETIVLLDLLDAYPSFHHALKPWYFRNAYQHNSELALNAARQIVSQADKRGVQLRMGVVMDEVKKRYQIEDPAPKPKIGNSDYSALSARRANQKPDYVPSMLLSGEEKKLLEQFHRLAYHNGFPTSMVSDLADRFAKSKWESIRKRDPLPLLDQKYLSDYREFVMQRDTQMDSLQFVEFLMQAAA